MSPRFGCHSRSADLHRSVAVDGRLHLRVTSDRWHGDGNDPFPGRFFEHWNPDRLERVVEGAGFAIDEITDDGKEWIDVEATRMRTLADTVGSGMRVLLVGLNPSVVLRRRRCRLRAAG